MKPNNILYNHNSYKKYPENEDSEDGFISPADISIKDEKLWEPTDEEILSYALKLGYDIEKDPDELFEVAYYYMKYPIPEGWKRGIMKSTKELVYINFVTGEIEVRTEIEEMAHQMYLEKKSEMNQKNLPFQKNLEKKETTTVIPRKKIPPLNPLQKSNNSINSKNIPSIKNSNSTTTKNNENKNQIFKSNNDKKEMNKNNNILENFKNDNDKILKLNNNTDKILDKYSNENELKDLYSNNKNKNENNIINNIIISNEKEKKIDLEKNKKENLEFLLNLGGNDDEEEDEELEDEDDIITKNDKEEKEDSFLHQMLKREKEIEELRKQKEKDIENVINKNENLKNIINMNNKKSEYDIELKSDNMQLFKDKKEYLKKKLEELKEYSENIKNEYKAKKEISEKDKKSKKLFYDKKLKEEINNNKSKLERQFKEKLELYEKQLINKKVKEEKKYKDELIKNYKLKKEENKEIKKKNEENKKEELKQKKLEFLKEIDTFKAMKLKNESKLSQIKLKIQNHILLIDEKKNIEKKNRVKKNEFEIKKLENQFEKDFQQNKIKNLTSISLPIQINNLDEEGIKSNFLDEMQKVLDEEYNMNCKTFQQELENKKLKEINKYINLMTEEKNEKMNFYKNEINLIEKDYYKSISNIRNKFQKNKSNNENNLKLKFDQTLNDYEETKKLILEQNQNLMKYINDHLNKLMTGNYTLKQTENKLDEFLLNLKDTYLLIYQKNKNNFEMYENDYIFKIEFIKYLLDIINYMTKTFNDIKKKVKIEQNNKNDEEIIKINENNDQNMAENLLIFCNEKVNEYKRKYKNAKNSSIFQFMNGNLMKSQSFNASLINEFDDINKTILFDISKRRKNNDTNLNIEQNLNNQDNNNKNKMINLKDEKCKDNIEELTYFVIDQDNNLIVPIIPQNILSNLNEDILILYSDITLFLKNEFNKIQQINEIIKKNNNKDNININLNLIILNKIKSFSEETFMYLLNNYQENVNHLNIKKKLRLILNHIEEYKNNFNLDKYISKINDNNKDIEEENDIVNQIPMNNNKIIKEDKIQINNFMNMKEDYFSKSNIISKNYSTFNKDFKEKEEQKQSGYDLNLSKSFKGNYNKTCYNGKFNEFYYQYNFNTLINTINNPLLYQFFNYKKNKYELDKSLGKFSIP